LLGAAIFVLYHSGEFFGIASTGGFFDRILLIPPLVFILRASIVIFLAIAFGFLMMLLFKDVEGFKIGGWEVQFTKQTTEGSEATISELKQANQNLNKEVEVLKAEKDAMQKALSQARRKRGDKK
jgi:cell division protein FtsB